MDGRESDEAYGVTVRQEIADRTGRDVSIGAIYATLDRLQRKALISSRTGEASGERGGRAKRHFRVLAKGIDAVNRTHETIRTMAAGLGVVRGLAR